MSDSVEFRHLEYLVAIDEGKNFTRAAEKLYRSQPAISQQVRGLEGDIGFPIFLRRGRDGVAADSSRRTRSRLGSHSPRGATRDLCNRPRHPSRRGADAQDGVLIVREPSPFDSLSSGLFGAVSKVRSRLLRWRFGPDYPAALATETLDCAILPLSDRQQGDGRDPRCQLPNSSCA